MDDKYFNRFITTITLIGLFILSYFVVKEILTSILFGIILAFIFYPIYSWINKKTNSPNISAFSVCILLLVLIAIPLWFFTPTLINQTFNLYISSQSIDIGAVLKTALPSLFTSDQFSTEIISLFSSLIRNSASSLVNWASDLFLNMPTIFLQLLIILFAFFYFLRDRKLLTEYVRGILPFPKEIEKTFFAQTKEITTSILYGQVVIGLLQGLIVGIGFLIFGVPNTLILTILACIAGVLPIIGTTVIWLPVAIYLVVTGSLFGGIGVIFFGILSNATETLGRSLWVSKRTSIHPAVVLVGMVGGIFIFGFIGFILGPLILAYLLIILDLYRSKNKEEVEDETKS